MFCCDCNQTRIHPSLPCFTISMFQLIDLNLLNWSFFPIFFSFFLCSYTGSVPLIQVLADGDRPCHRPQRHLGVFPALPWPSRRQCPRCRQLRLVISRRPKGHSSVRSRRHESATPTESRCNTTKPTTKRTRAKNGEDCTEFAPQMAALSRRLRAAACRPSERLVRITGGRPAWTTSSTDVWATPRRRWWHLAVGIACDRSRPITNLPWPLRIVRGLRAGVLSDSWASIRIRCHRRRVRWMKNCWRLNRWMMDQSDYRPAPECLRPN